MNGINEEEEGSACLSDFTKERIFRQQNTQGAQSQNTGNPARQGVRDFRGDGAAMVHPRYCRPRAGGGKATYFFRRPAAGYRQPEKSAGKFRKKKVCEYSWSLGRYDGV